MANWNPNNRASTTTWLTLRTLGQIPRDEVFKAAGSRKMNQLTYWAQSASGDIRKVQAAALAIQIDNVFRDIRGAQYEQGITNQTAVDNINETLLDKNKTIADLAEINDRNYLFWGESQNV